MDPRPLSAQPAPGGRPSGDGQPRAHRPVPAGGPGGHGVAEKRRGTAPPGSGDPGGPVRQGQLRLCEGGRRQRRRDRGLCPEPVRRTKRRGGAPLRAPVRFLPGLCGRAVQGRGRARPDGRAGAAPKPGGRGKGKYGRGGDCPQPLLRGGLGPGAGVVPGARLSLAR